MTFLSKLARLGMVLAVACGPPKREEENKCQSLSVPKAVATSQRLTEHRDARYIVRYRDRAAASENIRKLGGRFTRESPRRRATSVYLTPQNAARLLEDPAVLSVEPDAPRRLMSQETPSSFAVAQIPEAWAQLTVSSTGAKTCIIDSGIYAPHLDLQQSGISGNANWNTDGCGHGTHVAGTIAALDNSIGVVGVNKQGVNLHIIKAYDNSCGEIFSSDVAYAMDECVAAGAKVINMSLAGTEPTTLEREAADEAWSQGVLLVAAASNYGSNSMLYPASYASVISVGAVNDAQVVAPFSQRNAQVDLVAPGVGVLSTFPVAEVSAVTVGVAAYEGARITGSESTQGLTAALTSGGACGAVNMSLSGKLVLCERGLPLPEIVFNVQQSGGTGVIVYNNVTGAFRGSLGSLAADIPAITLSQADGQSLLSSAGSAATLVNKFVSPASGYVLQEGTSMSAPHVSGIAGMLMGEVVSAANWQVRAALESTAIDLGASGRDDLYGRGLVQASSALTQLKTTPASTVAPIPAFSTKCDGLACTFTVTAFDPDGAVVSAHFAFGDGATSDAMTASHVFANFGVYAVTLQVTDDDGLQGTVSVPISVINAGMTVTPGGLGHIVELSWQGVAEDTVLILRNHAQFSYALSPGTWSLDFDGSTVATYQVCTVSMESCSLPITGMLPPDESLETPGDEDDPTVVCTP